MKVCVLSCSPKKENSLGLQSAIFLKKFYPNDEFDIHYTITTDCPDEVVDAACDADLIMILSSIFHLHVHAQMMTMLDQLAAKLKAKLGDDINKKFFTYVTSSNFIYDVGAHRYVMHWAKSEKLNFLRLLSLKDDSLLSSQGQEELYRWFAYTKETIDMIRTGSTPKVTEKRRVAILNDGLPESSTKRVSDLYKERGCDVEVINLRDYKIVPCSACFACYTNRKCIMKDDMLEVVEKLGTDTDLVINMGTLRYGMLGQQFKMFTDRHVQFGRCGTGDDFVHITFVESDEEDEERLNSYNEYSSWDNCIIGVGREYSAGVHFMRIKDEEIDVTSQVNDTILIMNNELIAQRSVYSETLNTRFAELAHHLKFMVPLDYAHFEKEGYYKPQPVNMNVRPIDDLKGGLMSCKMRIMAYNQALEEVGETPKLTKRRPFKGQPYIEHLIKGDAAEKNEKGGLFGLFGKKK